MVGGGSRSKGEEGQMVQEMSDVNFPRASIAGSTSGGLMQRLKGPCRGWFSTSVFLHWPMLGQLRVRWILLGGSEEAELSWSKD